MPKGDDHSPQTHNHYLIDINGITANGKLGMSFSFCNKEFKKETIQLLTNLYKLYLEKIIDFCVNTEKTEMTASDFDAADLDQNEIEAIYNELEV